MLLRHYRAQGASKSALARRVGISQDTIHRIAHDHPTAEPTAVAIDIKAESATGGR